MCVHPLHATLENRTATSCDLLAVKVCFGELHGCVPVEKHPAGRFQPLPYLVIRAAGKLLRIKSKINKDQ